MSIAKTDTFVVLQEYIPGNVVETVLETDSSTYSANFFDYSTHLSPLQRVSPDIAVYDGASQTVSIVAIFLCILGCVQGAFPCCLFIINWVGDNFYTN